MKKETVSEAVVRRLPRYYRFLDELYAKGVVRISSSSLGEKMGITASQIRQDLSCFGEFGQQGYGYNIQELRQEIAHILGIDKAHSIIVVGVGNLGRALMKNFHFSDIGFTVEAAFDVDLRLVGTAIKGVPIYEMRQLEAYTNRKVPDVAVLTVPQSVAQETADRLIACGVRGIWNFTNLELSSENENVQFENVHFSDSLLTMNYRITRALSKDK